MPDRIAVAMSGGVDSSTSALLLKDAGYEVLGLSMRLFAPCREDADQRRQRSCCDPGELLDARRIADQLGIPYFEVDLEAEFSRRVVGRFAATYAEGLTPNPCIPCNAELKFGLLARRAEALGCRLLATGHYARIEKGTGHRLVLLRGVDRAKDQSYFLYRLTQGQLRRTLFPAGGMTKEEIRDIARRRGLPVAEKEESQEFCFADRDGYGPLVERLMPHTIRAGEVVDLEGQVLGTHRGIHRYTVGQRRGLGLPSSRPWYVVRLEPEASRVVVGREEDLYARTLRVGAVSWIAGNEPPLPLSVTARIRYRHRGAPALVESGPDARILTVSCEEPQRAITPGQAVVFYEGEQVLGGGSILRP